MCVWWLDKNDKTSSYQMVVNFMVMNFMVEAAKKSPTKEIKETSFTRRISHACLRSIDINWWYLFFWHINRSSTGIICWEDVWRVNHFEDKVLFYVNNHFDSWDKDVRAESLSQILIKSYTVFRFGLFDSKRAIHTFKGLIFFDDNHQVNSKWHFDPLVGSHLNFEMVT